MTHSRHNETFSRKILELFPRKLAGILVTARTNYDAAINFYACGYCFEQMLYENIDLNFEKVS